MKKLYGYALWALPDSGSSQRLQEIIDMLAQRYNTPSFVPHITIAHMLEGTEALLLAHCVRLASEMHSFSWTLDKCEIGDDVYRSVYFTGSRFERLYDCHTQALTHLGLTDEKPFFPHCSMLYGSLEQAEKEHIRKELELLLPMSLSVTALALWSVCGEPADWKEMGRIVLNGSQ